MDNVSLDELQYILINGLIKVQFVIIVQLLRTFHQKIHSFDEMMKISDMHMYLG